MVYHPSGGNYGTIEIINLDEFNPGLTCDNLSNFPRSIVSATGQLFQGTTPIICGGWRATNLCKCHSFKNGTWMADAPMNTCRANSGSIILKNPNKQSREDILIIPGGADPSTPALSSVESFDGKSWEQGRFASMPEAVTQHCLVKINDSVLMSIGGRAGIGPAFTGKTYFFDVMKNTWMAGPSMNTPRVAHSCGIMNWKNPSNGKTEKVVVVAGGRDQYVNDLTSVELLSIANYENSKTGWTTGPNLPQKFTSTVIVEFKNGVILVGGLYDGGISNRNLYQLLSPFGAWMKMKQMLTNFFVSNIAFLVPDDLVRCH